MSPRMRLACALALTIGVVCTLLAGCGGGDDTDHDADLRAWCESFVGPLTQQQQAECDRVRGTP